MAGDDFIDGDQTLDELTAEPGEETGLTAGEDEMPGGVGLSEEEEEEDEFAKSEEILNLRMQRSLRLKQNISEFVDQIAAKLVQNWLSGEEELSDGAKHRGARKQSR